MTTDSMGTLQNTIMRFGLIIMQVTRIIGGMDIQLLLKPWRRTIVARVLMAIWAIANAAQ